MTTTQKNSTLAALHALFSNPTPVEPPAPEAFDIPTNLDAAIEADAKLAWDGPIFRWYQGVDTKNVKHTFRFQRGHSLEQWHAQLNRQRITRVAGPFKSQQLAQATAV